MILNNSFVLAWFVLAALSVGYVVWDNFVRGNPEPVVMRWGWVLVNLYMGPVALALYVLSDKEPRPGEHEEFHQTPLEAGLGSTVHCVAGDATGIIIAAVIVTSLGLPMWLDLIIGIRRALQSGCSFFRHCSCVAWRAARTREHYGRP